MSPYGRFFGPANPGLVLAAALVVGAACLAWLHPRGFRLHDSGRGARGLLVAALAGTLLAGVMVAIDLGHVFPADLNVPAPHAFHFYPAMAGFVEVAFHLAPLTVLLFLLVEWTPINRESAVVLAILGVSVLEPSYQLFLATARGESPGLLAFLWLFIFVFNLLQLVVFRRYGFLSMLGLRLVYYLHWHVLWGYWRLELLF